MKKRIHAQTSFCDFESDTDNWPILTWKSIHAQTSFCDFESDINNWPILARKRALMHKLLFVTLTVT